MRYKNEGCCSVPSKQSSMVPYSPPMADQCQCINALISKEGNYERVTTATMLEAFANKTALQQYAEFMAGKGYASEYGLKCGAHDNNEPYCQAGGGSAGAIWCPEPWCYITAASCPGAQPTEFFKETVLNGLLYYSYPQCGGTDHFS